MAKNPRVLNQSRGTKTRPIHDMLFFEGMWDDNLQLPKPWVLALVFALHSLLALVLINSKTLNFKAQKPIPVEIIYQEPEPIIEKPKPEPEKPPEPILYKKPEIQKVNPIEPKPKPFKLKEAIFKPPPQKIQESENLKRLEPPSAPIESKIETPQPAPPKPKLIDIEKMMREIKIPNIKGPDIATDDLGNSADKSKINIKNPNSVLLNEPKPIKDPNLETKTLGNQNKILPNQKPINNFKLEQPKDYSKPAPIEIDSKLDAKTKNLGDNSKVLDAKQKSALDKFNRDELERQKQLEALEKQKQLAKPAANTPIAPNGELQKPSGITSVSPPITPPGGASPPSSSGNPPLAGGSPPNAGAPSGGLPKKPASYGKGTKNLFEEGEDNSAIGKVGRAIDCAKLGQKERSEKCPNWQPLESGAKKDIAPKTPKGFAPDKTKNKDPMPTCPKDHPNSNLGMPCLPQGKEPKIKF